MENKTTKTVRSFRVGNYRARTIEKAQRLAFGLGKAIEEKVDGVWLCRLGALREGR